MNREEKKQVVELLKEKFSNSPHFYLTDSGTLTVAQVNKFRAMCYEKGVEMKVVKNTLAKKALESIDDETVNYDQLYNYLIGNTAVLFTETANAPAKVLKEFRKENKRPILKVAYIEASLYEGDEQIEVLSNLKSKEELIGDIIVLLQSPMQNVVGALQSGQNALGGLLKALEERTS